MDVADQLNALLGEPIAEARQREKHALDELCRNRQLVVFGAGSLGRKVAACLGAAGAAPAAFADNRESLWGTELDGLPVLSPQEAATSFADGVFAVTICNPQPRSIVLAVTAQLRQLGCTRIVPFPMVLWRHPQALVPHFFWDLPSNLLSAADRIHSAFRLFTEPRSQMEFQAQLRLRLFADFEQLPAPCESPQYFPADLFALQSQECLVDCGAYDGDTIASFVAAARGLFRRIVAFEPDQANFVRLQEMIDGSAALRKRATAYPFAVDSTDQQACFAGDGGTHSSLSAVGRTVVECKALDDMLAAEQPTFIKMDIEGAEYGALQGAARIIRENNPILAICLYHDPQDFWRIPLLMSELEPEAQLFLRPYAADGFELVCYAVPPGRLLDTNRQKRQDAGVKPPGTPPVGVAR